ncbi:MAG: hypothetical protein KDJ86_09715 [Bauldia sp.]|uniref:hypothetical protein n=1 Tax=Bauldia sp. TaxID=2575872 RepID=UPI001DB571F8|nr:hypothetical protein [Bauldia sp.]MCB1496050.1 hypothetical protein [Bauldia sp.]
MSLKLSSLALGGAALCFALGATQAFAADATAIADALVAAMQSGDNTTAKYEGATAIGDDVTVTGFTATNPNGGVITIPTITIANAQPRDPGGFTASAMTFDNGKVVDSDTNVTWQMGSLKDATVPSPAEIKAKAHIRPFSEVTLTGLSILGSDMPAALDIGSLGVAIDIDDKGNPRDFDMKVASISIPPEVFAADPQQKAILDELGYTDGFTVNLNVAGAYETEGDVLTLRGFTLDTVDVGKLAIAGKFNGVSLGDIMQGKDPGDAGKDGALENLSIRFDNAGVVERVLDMQAKMMGVQRQDVVTQFAGALPFMLNFIGNPAFQDKVAKAGAAFLNDPKSISITVSPAQPVKFVEIMGTANQAPQTLPDMLAVDVVANN